MKKVEVSSAARSAARILREEILAGEEGRFLGSEDDLMQKLGISRPTFRQAARLLDHEQLLTVKRGVGGGFFSRRPSIETVAHSVSIYLRSRDTTLSQIVSVNRSFNAVAAIAAAKCTNEALIAEMRHLRDSMLATEGTDVSATTLIDDDTKFAELLGRMAENPAIELCLHMFYQFGRENRNAIWSVRPDRISTWREMRRKHIDAILAGDLKKIEHLSNDMNAQIMAWFREDADRRVAAAPKGKKVAGLTD